ncbi:hypothetical protein [Streptacidiphilus sp. PAMC 29251]
MKNIELLAEDRPTGQTWGLCLTAADQLVSWHLDHDEQSAGVLGAQRPHVVVLLASAIHSRAGFARLSDGQIADVALGDGYGAGVMGTVCEYPLSALESAPAAGPGQGERRQLLDSFGTHAFAAVQHAARTVVAHHIIDSGRPDPTLGERGEVMTREHRQGQ